MPDIEARANHAPIGIFSTFPPQRDEVQLEAKHHVDLWPYTVHSRGKSRAPNPEYQWWLESPFLWLEQL